jgi:hypothetical protein
MVETQFGNLDGYRGPRTKDTYEAMEGELRALQALARNDPDADLIREVLKADELVRALNNNPAMMAITAYATRELDAACMAWQMEADPASQVALDAHRNARAARMLINWIDETIRGGQQAEAQLEEADRDERET